MKHVDMLKLRWLRMEAINDLQSEEHDIVVEFTTRYQMGGSPSFSDEEVSRLEEIYKRVRGTHTIGGAGTNDSSPPLV